MGYSVMSGDAEPFVGSGADPTDPPLPDLPSRIDDAGNLPSDGRYRDDDFNVSDLTVEHRREGFAIDRMLYAGTDKRKRELGYVAEIIATAAHQHQRRAAIGKVLIVALGALAATSGTATVVAGSQSAVVTIIYAVVGLAIATLGGLEAGFRPSERGTELVILAATCWSAIREIDSRWHREVRSAPEAQKRIAAERILSSKTVGWPRYREMPRGWA